MKGADAAVLKREALHADVWSRPGTKIAAEIGISSSALKRICKAMDIPTPPTGYWAKKQHGKSVRQRALPAAGDQTRLEWVVDLANSRCQREKTQSILQVDTSAADDSPLIAGPAVELAKDTEHLHPLVKATRAQWREDERKIDWSQRKERKRLNLGASKDALERALIFLDALARGVEALGFSFRCKLDEKAKGKKSVEDVYGRRGYDEPSGVCWVQAGEETISLRLRERHRRVKREDAKYSWDTWDKVPSGVFEFSLGGGWGFGHRTTWNDSKRQQIEEFLPEILATFRPLADYMRDSRIRREEEEALSRRISNFRWKMDRQRREEEEAFEMALKKVSLWRKAARVREFIAEFEKRLDKENVCLEGDSPGGILLRWLKMRADMMDPLGRNSLHLADALLNKLPGWYDPEEDDESVEDEEET